MSKMPNYFFGFNRPLPNPFDICSKRVDGVQSNLTPANVHYSTLTGPVLKALMRYCDMLCTGRGGGLGLRGGKTVCEYVSSVPDSIHLTFYNPSNGDMLISVFDKTVKSFAEYKIAQNGGRDCTVVFLTLIPELSKNDEFKEYLDKFVQEYNRGFVDLNYAANIAAVLCDNVYRQIENGVLPLKANIVTPKKLGLTQYESGDYDPDTVLCGRFEVLNVSTTTTVTPVKTNKIEEFVGAFKNPQRTLTPEEEKRVPVLEPWIQVPDEAILICKHIFKTTGLPQPMRNFFLRGPAGTGKSTTACAIAAGLGLPYVDFTCSANTEIYDFCGQMLPVEGKEKASILDSISSDDIYYAPEEVYKKLTGKEKPDATSDEVLRLMLDINAGKESAFRYTETDFLKALKYGWVCEIKEPTVILQQGVLVGLNTLLEQGGSITLPTGEVITRHPDAVILITTNMSYEGCRLLNQSVTDRMNIVLDIDLPPLDIVKSRAMAASGFTDDHVADKMVRVLDSMSEYVKNNDITDGEVGVRSLIDWMKSTIVTGDPHSAAMYTIIAKASGDSDSRKSLVTTCLDPVFPRKR